MVHDLTNMFHDLTMIFGGMVLTIVLMSLDCPIADAITARLELTIVLILMDMRGDLA